MSILHPKKNSTTSAGKQTKGINIPPQSTIPKMPPSQPPKKSG